MTTRPFTKSLAFGVALTVCFTGKPLAQEAPAPFVILKLDDLGSVTPRWQKVVDHLKEKNVKASIGIVCNSLEGDKPSYYAWIKELHESRLVEFWNHGLTHREWQEGGVKMQEFKGTSYEQQKANFSRSQQLGVEKLGITFRTFGAPFNAIDENTLKVLREDPSMKVLLYGKPSQAASVPNLMILDRTTMNIESPIFQPNAEQVENDYRKLVGTRNCFVLQGHPNQWDDARFKEFVKLLDFLKEQGVTFTTPYEYYLATARTP